MPRLDGPAFAEMKPVVITARDGLKIHAFLTLPVGAPAKNLPIVLAVHGGPWGRYAWGFNPYVQRNANRGYAVLQPNFRGSTGYGKKFLNAGNKQFGLKMKDQPDRQCELGGERRDRRSCGDWHHWVFLRWLLRAGRRHLHTGSVRLRGGHLRSI